jgi:hypothetical protein
MAQSVLGTEGNEGNEETQKSSIETLGGVSGIETKCTHWQSVPPQNDRSKLLAQASRLTLFVRGIHTDVRLKA